ncbi:unnamed protein product [Leptosia nina]|uniref:Uncharacterized protein n=1 Tax=Leptosia nina TaxID=320188 RepID=A0AAV1JI65_9NEOP
MSTSNVSAVSSKQKEAAELTEELESIRALNANLQTFLDYLQTFRKNLIEVNNNCKEFHKVNKQWIETVSNS